MNIELISWLIAFIVVWEAMYVFGLKISDGMTDWFEVKGVTFIFTCLFFALQGMIVFTGAEEYQIFASTGHYGRLVWEVGILLGLGLFFYLNKKIADWVR
jgi:hypothetical protein